MGEPVLESRDVGEQMVVHSLDPHPPVLLCLGLSAAVLRKCFRSCLPLNPLPINSEVPVGEDSSANIALISYSTTHLFLLKRVHIPKRESHAVLLISGKCRQPGKQQYKLHFHC